MLPQKSTQLTVTGASHEAFSLPLARPLTTESGTTSRKGVLLHLRVSGGGKEWAGIGEASPLPGTSQLPPCFRDQGGRYDLVQHVRKYFVDPFTLAWCFGTKAQSGLMYCGLDRVSPMKTMLRKNALLTNLKICQ